MDTSEVLVEEVSPDGELVLWARRHVEQSGEVVVSIGFGHADWHIHPELFDLCQGKSAEQAARDIVADVVADRMLVVTNSVPGFRQVTIAGPLELELDVLAPNETLEFRFWSGRQVAVEDLIDRKVTYLALV
jgi:hypothetical protein